MTEFLYCNHILHSIIVCAVDCCGDNSIIVCLCHIIDFVVWSIENNNTFDAQYYIYTMVEAFKSDKLLNTCIYLIHKLKSRICVF